MTEPTQEEEEVTLDELGVSLTGEIAEEEEVIQPNLDVIEFLQKKAESTLGDKTEVEVPDEIKHQLKEAAVDSTTEQERVTLPDNPVNGDGTRAVRASNIWLAQPDDIGEVEVTEYDREAYMRSMLHEDPLVLKVTIGKEFTVLLRSPTDPETRIVFAVAAEEAAKAPVLFPENAGLSYLQNYTAFLQKYLAVAQVTQIGDKPCEFFVLESDPRIPEDIEAAKEQLRTCKAATLDTWSDAKWSLVFHALRIFEEKLKRCREGVINGDF